jgi:hypothetical protein
MNSNEIHITLKGIEVRVYPSNSEESKWSAQIGQGYYHWECPKVQAIEKAKGRVIEILTDILNRKLK